MTPTARSWTLLYDPDCGFCKWTVTLALGRDRERTLQPLALGTAEADALLSDLTPAERLASFHLISPDGTRTSAGPAVPALLRLLRGGHVPAALFAALPRLTERAYWWVADNRSSLSRLVPGRAKQRASATLMSYERVPR
jgi:predicted DCC family thiol-disulfide oxidoreductase YuxK